MMCIRFFFQAEDGIRDGHVTGVQTCALPIFIAATGNGHFVLCRDLHKFTLNQLVTAIRMPVPGLQLPEELDVPWWAPFSARFRAICECTPQQLGMTLVEVFETGEHDVVPEQASARLEW